VTLERSQGPSENEEAEASGCKLNPMAARGSPSHVLTAAASQQTSIYIYWFTNVCKCLSQSFGHYNKLAGLESCRANQYKCYSSLLYASRTIDTVQVKDETHETSARVSQDRAELESSSDSESALAVQEKKGELFKHVC
jgi:hypothetical protein